MSDGNEKGQRSEEIKNGPNPELKEVYLFDPENGRTTKQFIIQLKHLLEEDNIFLEDFKKQEDNKLLPLVTVVRSTTERVEEDLDAILQSISDQTFPVIILYFHLKGCSDISQTKELIQRPYKYKNIREIIDMDFSGFTLQKRDVKKLFVGKCYRTINESARALLAEAINDLKNDITTFKMTKNTLIIHDTIGTDLSCQIINELKQYMVGKIKIDTKDAKELEQQQQGVNTTKNNQIDVGILAVFCDAETFRNEEHEIWKKFASGFYSIAFCLYKEDSDETDKGMPDSCVIELQPSNDKKVITYLICESLLKILHKCQWQKQTSAEPTESTNEQKNSEQPATDSLEPAYQSQQ